MASQYTSAEGSLYELVARGKKDVFFYQDLPNSLFAFDNGYEAQAPSSFEVRRVPPLTACEFGRTVVFEFDLVGDIMKNPTIIINLPTWLPPTVAAQNGSTLVTDLSGVSYGYTNGIGFFLFELIQFYQDNILLQEFSGDALWATTKNQENYGQAFLTSQLMGEHDGSPLSIGRNATPPQLRLALPLVGCQRPQDPGFPQRSALSHSYRLKCKLRRLEDLVEASDGRPKPAPWRIASPVPFQQQLQDGTIIPFYTIYKNQMAPPLLQLETTQIYIPAEYQDEIQKPQKLAFVRTWENTFTQSEFDYTSVVAGGTAYVKRLLDGRHPSGRLTWFFRSVKSIQANQLWKINTGIEGAQSYFTTVGLQIAGKDRELPRSPLIWRDVNNFAKEENDTGMEINTMNWGLGSIAPLRFPEADGQPTGTVNFTSADRPTFYIGLATPDVPNTQLLVIVDGWARFDTDGRGRAELFSGN